jgi:hypothetical protein
VPSQLLLLCLLLLLLLRMVLLYMHVRCCGRRLLLRGWVVLLRCCHV